ncbi:hypothetical protein ANCCEY_09968 [Ancylostoma ceylanicum]|uniref:Uncharacterized protein n=1 Tax=Ancylostoma ceylanicum TaxID=53326 RepID=A0A0D6LIB6_9BILA|nr:hypothetical protein ANCCEY_09968 [Ancylostoma ceylanicum]
MTSFKVDLSASAPGVERADTRRFRENTSSLSSGTPPSPRLHAHQSNYHMGFPFELWSGRYSITKFIAEIHQEPEIIQHWGYPVEEHQMIPHAQSLFILLPLLRASADRHVIPMERPPDLLPSNPFFIPQSNPAQVPEWTPPPPTASPPPNSLPIFGENPAAPVLLPFGAETTRTEQYAAPGVAMTAVAAPPAPLLFPPPFMFPTATLAPPLVPFTVQPMSANPRATTMKPINIDPEAIMGVNSNFGMYIYGDITRYGFVFADQGFDVWLGNMRGNIYSKEHVALSSESNDFWKFRLVTSFGII